MEPNQKGAVQVILAIVAVISLTIIGYYLYSVQKFGVAQVPNLNIGNLTNQTNSAPVAPIQNTNDLNKVSASLDTMDTTQIDSQLNALNSAASGF